MKIFLLILRPLFGRVLKFDLSLRRKISLKIVQDKVLRIIRVGVLGTKRKEINSTKRNIAFQYCLQQIQLDLPN